MWESHWRCFSLRDSRALVLVASTDFHPGVTGTMPASPEVKTCPANGMKSFLLEGTKGTVMAFSEKEDSLSEPAGA